MRLAKLFSQGLLRRRDQTVIAVGVVSLLGFLAWRWWGPWAGDPRELDTLPRREARFQVDINRAAWSEIAQLPEIGETLAKRIVAHRDAQGPFGSHDELDKVDGIGVKTLEKIKPYLAPIGANPVQQPP